jgi:phosphoesterase RecJ-like protein
LPGNSAVIDFEVNPTLVAEKVASADLVFCLDFNRLSRINQLGELVREAKASKVMIDHHLEPDSFSEFTYWNHEASSTCELVYLWIKEAFGQGFISKDIATCLYTGLMTDTGNFQHNNTKPFTLRCIYVGSHQIMGILSLQEARNYSRMQNGFDLFGQR